jgi:hypothetical protein
MERHRQPLGRRFIMTPLFALVCVISLSSCSLWQSWFGSDSKVKIVKPPSCSPFEPTCTSQGPYKQVKLDTPANEVYQPKLYVIKGERRLLVVDHDVLVREYKVGLGPRTFGDKFFQGDGRTPEGEFFICVKNPNSRFYKSLGLSYPAPHHAERALLAGDITLEEYHNIVTANAHKTRPPWNTALGGEIFIHGGGAQEDWTHGCVAVYDRAMDELFTMVPVGTPVQILP